MTKDVMISFVMSTVLSQQYQEQKDKTNLRKKEKKETELSICPCIIILVIYAQYLCIHCNTETLWLSLFCFPNNLFAHSHLQSCLAIDTTLFPMQCLPLFIFCY